MSRITLDVADLDYFMNSIENYGLSAEVVDKGFGYECTLEGDRMAIQWYLESEYCVGMSDEEANSYIEDIE